MNLQESRFIYHIGKKRTVLRNFLQFFYDFILLELFLLLCTQKIILSNYIIGQFGRAVVGNLDTPSNLTKYATLVLEWYQFPNSFFPLFL